jgi:uncharacterized protein
MKKNKIPLTQPLSESELTWLQNYLDTLSQTNAECMTLETLDGLFCALIINPVMAKPADWMNTIFGQKRAIASEEELERVMMILIRYWNHISSLIEKSETYLPRVMEYDENDPINRLAKQWAIGFHIGLDYCRKDWDDFLKDEKNAPFLAPFLLLEIGDHSGEKGEALTYEKRKELLAMIPAIVHRLFHYWVEKTTTDKKETKPKVGRNDPCPCGSGKKYKKCCDA